MLIKNLQLKFNRREGDKVIFSTEAGAELAVSDYLLDGQDYENSDLFLSLDKDTMLSSVDSKKETLNELLDNQSG